MPASQSSAVAFPFTPEDAEGAPLATQWAMLSANEAAHCAVTGEARVLSQNETVDELVARAQEAK